MEDKKNGSTSPESFVNDAMNIGELEAFLTVVETRNLSQAAKQLYVTQSTISYRISSLEEELNLKLIERNRGSRNIEITPKGKAMVGIAERWISLMKEAQLLQERHSYQAITVAQVDWFSAYPFSRLYNNIMEISDLKLDIKTGHTSSICSMVSEMTADIGFVVRRIVTGNLIYKPLYRDPLVMVCSKQFKLHEKTIDPKKLEAQNEIFWGYFGDYRFWHDQWWDSSIVPYLSVDFSVPMSFQLLDNPANWLVSPRSVAEKMVAEYPFLSIRSFASPPPDMIVYMVQRNMPSPNVISAVSRFAELVADNVDILTDGRDYMKL